MNNDDTNSPLIGESNHFLGLLDHTSELAKLHKPVLIMGERGTGKELIASRLHYLSERWKHPFIKLNCAALTENLLESELFGHEIGAFTGASKRHIGKFEQANNGTLFLDEIANTSKRLQQKILRVIEYSEFERVGGSRTVKTNVRIVAATNVDLPTRANEGSFAWDLLDRLSFDVITLPPLRSREKDIALLANHFAIKMTGELGLSVFHGFGTQAMDQLMGHKWPGNVRELKNVVERAVFHASINKKKVDKIQFDPFDSPFRLKSGLAQSAPGEKKSRDIISNELPKKPTINNLGFKEKINELEKHLVSQALDVCHFNQKKAADYLQLTYHQLRGLMRKHGLSG